MPWACDSGNVCEFASLNGLPCIWRMYTTRKKARHFSCMLFSFILSLSCLSVAHWSRQSVAHLACSVLLLPVCLWLCLLVSLHVFSIWLCLFICPCLSVCLSFSVCHYVCLSLCMYVCLLLRFYLGRMENEPVLFKEWNIFNWNLICCV